jgi:hypothetical protein
LGLTAAALYLRGGRIPLAGAIHGIVGTVGLGTLVLALQGPRRGDAMGAGSFGIAGSVLFGVALALGPFIPLLNRRSARAAGLVIATHATAAITAYVLFLAWASFR